MSNFIKTDRREVLKVSIYSEELYKNEISLVDSIFNDDLRFRIHYNVRSMIDGNNVIMTIINSKMPGLYINLYISKIKDDWYYITFYLKTSLYPKTFPSKTVESYYKCDQFDGLKECLDSLIEEIKDYEKE